MTPRIVPFNELDRADLQVGAVYRSGSAGNFGDDPLNRLLRCGNQGGFRFRGSNTPPRWDLVVLYTTFADPDWPDHLDESTRQLVYYGDNKEPGFALHDTPKGGRLLLRHVFALLHGASASRNRIPPFFVFSKHGPRRDVLFHGIAVPGAPGVSETEDLVAIWKNKDRRRFQNYRALFTILDVPVITRAWINDLFKGIHRGATAPAPWTGWVARGF